MIVRVSVAVSPPILRLGGALVTAPNVDIRDFGYRPGVHVGFDVELALEGPVLGPPGADVNRGVWVRDVDHELRAHLKLDDAALDAFHAAVEAAAKALLVDAVPLWGEPDADVKP
jgi:hypothetical protein